MHEIYYHNNILEWLILPMEPEKFFKEYWEKKPLHIERRISDYFSKILNIEDLDHLLSSIAFPATNFNLAKNSEPLATDLYCIGNDVDMERALSEHRKGATIILRALNKWCLSLQKLRLETERAFSCSVQTNVYLTPPENQSTPPHWDTHDLFILQFEGIKIWKLYDAPYKLPLSHQRFTDGVHETGPLSQTITLKPGDILYLPRGIVHEPVSKNYSAHISLGVHVKRYVDLLAELARIASEEDEAWRRSFRLSAEEQIGKKRQNISKTLTHLLQGLCAPNLIETAQRKIHKDFAETRDSDTSGHLLDIYTASSLSCQSKLRRRPGSIVYFEEEKAKIKMRWRSHQLSCPSGKKAALKFIAGQEEFSVCDIPGELSNEEKIAIASVLVENGLLYKIQD